MNFIVYVIQSTVNGKFYIGHTSDLDRRLKEHNAGKTKSIKPYIPYKLVCFEELITREEAVLREKYLKSGIGRDFIKSKLH